MRIKRYKQKLDINELGVMEKICEYRIKHNMTQEEFCEFTGICRSTITHIENKSINSIKTKTKNRLEKLGIL